MWGVKCILLGLITQTSTTFVWCYHIYNKAGTCIPQCANTGKWEKKQCCGEGANKKCRCVNPDTGAQTREPTTDTNITC